MARYLDEAQERMKEAVLAALETFILRIAVWTLCGLFLGWVMVGIGLRCARASDGLWRDPADPNRVLYCQAEGGRCWWLERVDVGKPGAPAPFEEARIVDFPCAEIQDNRGLTLEPMAAPTVWGKPGGLCYVGGEVSIEIAAGAPPPYTVGVWVEDADPFLVQGVHVKGTATGVRAGKGSAFFVRQSHFEGISETCIDNAAGAPGHVTDTLFDGCFRLYDGEQPPSGGNPADEVVIENSLIRLAGEAGAAAPFRLGGRLPRLRLLNNVFLLEGSPVSGVPGFPDPSILSGCRGNTVVWLGPGELGGNWPAECVTVTGDKAVWDAAVQAWGSR